MKKSIMFIMFLAMGFLSVAQNWQPLSGGGTDGSTSSKINSMLKDPSNGVMYVGGDFDSIGNQAIQDFAVYDGSNLSTLGSGISGIQGYTGEFVVYSSLGLEVYRGYSGFADLSKLKEGIYFISVEDTFNKIIIK